MKHRSKSMLTRPDCENIHLVLAKLRISGDAFSFNFICVKMAGLSWAYYLQLKDTVIPMIFIEFVKLEDSFRKMSIIYEGRMNQLRQTVVDKCPGS